MRVVAVLVLLAAGVVAGAASGATTDTTPTTTTKTTVPTIGSFSPGRGGVGATVVIRGMGTGLLDATDVSFNGVSAAFTAGTEFLDATVPAGATTGPITVTTPEGSATSATSFIVTPPESDVASTYQIGSDHSGLQSDAALAPPYTRRWVATLDGSASYPLIAAGKVFVTTWSGTPNTGTTLWALDQATGSVVWSKAVSGYYGFSAAAYDQGLVFFVNAGGTLAAYDAATGATEWSGQILQPAFVTSPPTAANGVVYVSASGWLYAFDELTGGMIAFTSVENGDHSSPAVSGGKVFVSYACNQAYGFATTSLDPLWHYSTFCSGGGGKTTVAADGRVYTRDFNGNLILDAATGNLLGSFTPASTTAFAPAVDQSSLYAMTAPANTTPFILSAQSVADGSTSWSFTGDGRLDTAPVVLSTPSGEYVVAGSSSGMLYALDAATGAQVWSTNVGASIQAPDEQNALPLSGLGAGQGLLVVPAGNTVSVYVHGSIPSLSSFTPAAGPVGATVTITGTNLSGATAVSVNGTPVSSFTVDSDTQVTAVVAAGTTSGPISVTTPGGTATSGGTFTVIPAPSVSSFTPASGPVGTTVTISGSHLSGATAVRVDNTAVASFTVLSDTQITAVVAAGTTTGLIGVTTAGGTATSANAFRVIPPDFALSASPGTATVALGKSGAYTVTVAPTGGFNGAVALSVTGLPSGATASFSPSSTTSTSTLTVQVAHNARVTTGTLTIRGTSGSLSHTTTVVLQISKK
jgi:outer membrane protein assembly factor BamB